MSTKGKMFEDTEAAALTITAAENEARNFIAKTELVMARNNNGPWIYGSYGPTALDAHFIIFLRRMKDVGYYDIFTESISRYLTDAEKTPEFQHILQGRDTVPASMKKNRGGLLWTMDGDLTARSISDGEHLSSIDGRSNK
jgi:hypothetical protein